MHLWQLNSSPNRRNPMDPDGRFTSLSSFVVAVVLTVVTGCVYAESLGINFLGNVASSVSGNAGVLPITNWNNIANATFTTGTIHSSDGQASFALTMSGSGTANGWNNGSTADGSNGSLMKGYNDTGSNLGAVTNRINGFAGPSYSVFIYVDGDVSRPSAAGDLLPNYTVNGTRYYAAALGGTFAEFVQASVTANNTNRYPPSLTYGNFLEIDDVAPAGGAITISANSDNSTFRSPLNGIEIVASAGPPAILIQPQAQTVFTGSVAQLSATVWGASPGYRWRKNGSPLTEGGNIFGSRTSRLTLTNLTLADTGDYDLVVTNNYGSVTSLETHLEVKIMTIADRSINAFNAAFLTNLNSQTYYRSSLTNAGEDGTWTLAIDIEGEEDACERTGDPQHQKLVNDLCTSFIVINPGNWSWDGWNDDIGWNSLALVRGYQMTGTASLLTAAENGYNFAFGRGWDTNYNGGGIWEQQPANMPTNQPPSKNPLACDSLGQVACMLYQSTSNATYLAQAQLIYAWVRTNIYNANTGQVYGQISTNGIVDTSANVYNQGTFADYANLLHNITGNPMYYNDAVLAVEYTKNHLTSNNNGNGILNNSAAYLNTWAAEFARGLGHLTKDNPQLWGSYYPWMVANCNAAWTNRRTDLNLTWNGWAEPTPSDPGMIPTKCVSAVAMYQFTPVTQPGLVENTNPLTGSIIGTPGSWNNGGNTIAKVFDNNIATYFDAPTGATGTWVGLDFGAGVSNVIAQINYWPRSGYEDRMVGGVFQGDNGPTFPNPVTLCTVITVPPSGGVAAAQSITNRSAFRCVRFLAPTNNPSCNVAEIKFFAPDPPVVITNHWDGSQLTLSWPGGGMLLEATKAAGPWTTNAGAVSPFSASPVQSQKFYRVRF